MFHNSFSRQEREPSLLPVASPTVIYTAQIQRKFSNAPSTVLNSLQCSNQIYNSLQFPNQVKCWFLGRGESRSTRRNTSRSRVENQQTQPTYDAESGNRTQGTLMEGERSHHSNPAVIELINCSKGVILIFIYLRRLSRKTIQIYCCLSQLLFLVFEVDMKDRKRII